jgi:hypothetical protein
MLLAMYLPTPGKIAIIGAGPIGLEAALYARYLGYAVEVFERGRAAENVLSHGDELLATPFVLTASPLGLAALAAQDESYRPPQADEVLTGRQWVERYLGPLAQSDLLIDGLHEQTTVINIESLAPAEPVADGEEDDDAPPPPAFRLHVRTATGEAQTADANVVINASGAGQGEAHLCLSGAPNYYGVGGNTGASDFTFAQGLGQIRDLFKIIGGRESLDLYASMQLGK